MINEKEISDCLKSLFLCTGRIRRLAAELNVPRAASRRNKSPPSPIHPLPFYFRRPNITASAAPRKIKKSDTLNTIFRNFFHFTPKLT